MSVKINNVTTTVHSASEDKKTLENQILHFHMNFMWANSKKLFTLSEITAEGVTEPGEDTIMVHLKNDNRIELKILDIKNRQYIINEIAKAIAKKAGRERPAPSQFEQARSPVIPSERRRSHGSSGIMGGLKNTLPKTGSASSSAPVAASQTSPHGQKRSQEAIQPRSADAAEHLAAVAASAVGRHDDDEREQEAKRSRGSFLDNLPTSSAITPDSFSRLAHSSGPKRIAPQPSGLARSGVGALFRRPSCPQESSSYHRYRSSETFGLRNLGNTCYFNATMQALCSLREFTADLASMADSVPEIGHGELYKCTVDIFKQMSSSTNAAGAATGPLSPAQLRAIIARGNAMFSGNEQQDAHEFFLEYLNQLHDELLASRTKWLERQPEGTGDSAVVATQRHFDSEVQKHLVCEACGKGRDVSERFMDFSIDFDGQSDVDDCTLHSMLASYFSDESLEAKCENCGEPRANMTKRITALPKVLVLHLKRFMPNVAKQQYDKHHQNVLIQPLFDLGAFAARSDDLGACQDADPASPPKPSPGRLPARPLASMAESPRDFAGADVPFAAKPQGVEASPAKANCDSLGSSAQSSPAKIAGVTRGQYELRSVVTHDGPSPQAGHYVTYARGVGGVWRLYDDSVVRELPKTFEPQQELGRRAYILYYVLQN